MPSRPTIGDMYRQNLENLYAAARKAMDTTPDFVEQLGPVQAAAEEFNAEMEAEKARRTREIRELRAKL